MGDLIVPLLVVVIAALAVIGFFIVSRYPVSTWRARRKVFRGFPLTDNGETEATKTLHRVTPFSLTGTVMAVRIMWESLSERTEAASTPLKESQAMPAARLKAMT